VGGKGQARAQHSRQQTTIKYWLWRQRVAVANAKVQSDAVISLQGLGCCEAA
jgi:hypothetical protein